LSRREDLVTPKVPDILHSAAADQVFPEKVEKFKGLYSSMDIAELTEIANDKRYSPEAKQAASDLIIELKNKI
jgi:hypothetical protein